jgi:hypothetical protein
MAKFFERLSPELIEFINRQNLFFIATAPPLAEGRINLSPKGMDTFRVLSDDTVAYLDLTGSGNETAAHLRHDPHHRVTVMFCSFDAKPLILRLYGRGEVVRPRDPAWQDLSRHFPSFPGTRQVIVVKIQSGQTSCGFGVPVYELKNDDRTLMREWAEKKRDAGIRQYWADKNTRSIDGLESGLLD